MKYCKDELIYKFSKTKVEIIYNLEKSLYDCLGIADWVVGMTSTALYEATMFDAKVAIIDHVFSEGSKPLYESGKALLVKDAKDLANNIISNKFIPNSDISFFKKDSLKNMEDAIEKIICEG